MRSKPRDAKRGLAALVVALGIPSVALSAEPAAVFPLRVHIAARPGLSALRELRLRQALESAVDSWNATCPHKQLVVGSSVSGRGAQEDTLSTVRVLSRKWCRRGWDPHHCYEPAQLAVTTTWKSAPAGEEASGGALALTLRPRAREADIEINAVHFDWFGDAPKRRRPPVSLEVLLTHELGHVLGFSDVAADQVPPSEEWIMVAAAHVGRSPLVPSPRERAMLCQRTQGSPETLRDALPAAPKVDGIASPLGEARAVSRSATGVEHCGVWRGVWGGLCLLAVGVSLWGSYRLRKRR